ncbi:MAG: DUF503 domain-containing protein [Candidatus Hydrogenedentes bacterium]|nr:DUF503 domain-containing protein [Candidatus Hydrogenedentota bacterium]
MTIGVLHLDFLLHGARSLKDKRRVIKGLKDQLRSRFNCSVAETEYHDLWQRARVSVCVISNESRHANTQLDEIARFAALRAGAELLDYRIEML